MSSRLKEDEKNERIIRGLLKLPENRRCINCNSMGPQYVCTTFWTFVCTSCSGIHREFTHRVKSVSMAKFTSQEVSALQGGGNQRARDIYFKGLDPQGQSLPDGSNVERLRDFIKHVYVNKKYAVERNDDKPPKGTTGEKDNYYENKSPSGSRSPQYEDTYDRRSDRSSSEGRSPGYESKYGDYGKSPSRAEVVNDWHRDDRFRNRMRSEEESHSPEQGKDQGSSSPPVVRPVREILRDSVVPLRISEPPKASVTRVTDGSAVTKQTVPSIPPTIEKPQEVKLETAVSLIDFDADPEPLAEPTAATQAHQSTNMLQPVTQSTASTANDNWANFDVAPGKNVSQAPSSVQTLDFLLSELSVPATAPPVQTSGQPSGPSTSTDGTSFIANHSVGGNTNTVSPYGMGNNYSAPASSFSNVPADGQWSNVQQHQPSLFPTHVSQPTQNIALLQSTSSGNQDHLAQPWNTSFASNVHRSLSAPALQPLHAASNPVHEVNSGGLQPSSEEQKPIGRKELPQDLFSGTYPYHQGHAHGWQTIPPRYNVQYNAAPVPFQSFQQPPQSSNPFDFNNEPPAQTQSFPSLAPLQGALPSMQPPSGLLRTSSLDFSSPVGMASQTTPHPFGAPSQAQGHYPSAMPLPPRYMPPQIPANMSHSHVGSFNNMAVSYGPQTTDQQLPGPFSAPQNPHSFPSGGNPFG